MPFKILNSAEDFYSRSILVDKHLEHLSGTIALAETEGREAEPVGKDSWGESSIENWFGDWWHLCIHCLGQRPAGGAGGIVAHTCNQAR